MKTSRKARAILASAAVMSIAAPARADAAADRARAEVLFEQGSRLLEEKKLAEACEKLAESRRLAIGLGVTLYLADCYESSGKLVAALALFREAERMAEARKDKRHAVAKDRADKLESAVPRIAFRIIADAPGLTITIDDVPVPRSVWPQPYRVDPGPHTVHASAPGRQPFSAPIEGVTTYKILDVEIPALAEAKSQRHATPASASGPSPGPSHSPIEWTPQRVAGAALAGAGVVSLVVGVAFGLDAKSKLDDSNADGHCRPDNQCDPVGLDLRDQSQSSATIANVTVGLGLVALAAGVVVFAIAGAPKSGGVAWRMAPAVGLDSAGLRLARSW